MAKSSAPVILPIELTVDHIEINDTDIKAINKSIRTKLADVSKSIRDVFNQIDPTTVTKSVSTAMDKVQKEVGRANTAYKDFQTVLQTAGKSTEEYKAKVLELRDAQSRLARTKEAMSIFEENGQLAERYQNDKAVMASYSRLLNDWQRESAEISRLQGEVEHPENMAMGAPQYYDRIVNAYDKIVQATNEAKAAGQNFNDAIANNRTTQHFQDLNARAQELIAKLQKIDEKTNRMSALGASEKSWEAINYDAEKYNEELKQVNEEMLRLINNGKAFQFKLQRGERVKARNTVTGYSNQGAGLFESITGKSQTGLTAAREEATKTRKEFGHMSKTGGDMINKLRRGFKKLTKGILMYGLGFRTAYYAIRRLRKAVIEDFGIMAKKFDEINQPLSEFKTAVNQLKGSVGSMLQPLVSAVLPILTQLIKKLSDGATELAKFFATFTGQDYIYKATAAQEDYAASLAKTNQQLGKYDELQVIGQNQSVDYEKENIDTDAIRAENETLFSTIEELWGKVKELGGAIKGFFSENVMPAISDAFYALAPVVSKAMSLLTDIINSEAGKTFMGTVSKTIGGIAKFAEGLIDNLGPAIAPILEIITKFMDAYTQIHIDGAMAIVDYILPLLGTLLQAITPLLDGIFNLITDIMTPIGSVMEQLVRFIGIVLTPIVNILAPILEAVGAIFDLIGDLVGVVMELIAPLMELANELLPIGDASSMLGAILTVLVKVMKVVFEVLKAIINFTIKPLIGLIKLVVEAIKTAVGWLKDKLAPVIDGVKAAFIGVTTWLDNFKKKISEAVQKAVSGFTNMKNGLKGAINAMLGFFEGFVNFFIKGINAILSGINRISFDMPDWLGGAHVGFNIPLIGEVSIPRLAQGAVLPANKQFLAMLGDQTHGTNVEAPLDTIKQALAEVLAEVGGTHESIVLQLDGREVAKVVWNESEKRYRQTGQYAVGVI